MHSKTGHSKTGHSKTKQRALRLGLLGLLLPLAGCLLPEIDTPPIDPSLIKEANGSSGTAAPDCTEGTYKNSVNLSTANATTTYAGECIISGQVTINLDVASYAKLAAVKTIQGNLKVKGTGQGAAVSPLPGLTKVSTSVLIDNTSVTNLPNFPRLATIGGSLMIRGNNKATAITGFNALTQVGSLQVTNNNATTWATFSKLKTVSVGVTVLNNWNLTKVALPAVSGINATLEIGKNPCTTIALGNMAKVGMLNLHANTKLTSVQAPKLTQVTTLLINGNGAATNTTFAFGNMKTLGDFTLFDQLKITELTWLGTQVKMSGGLQVCQSGISSADALAWFQKLGGQPKASHCN